MPKRVGEFFMHHYTSQLDVIINQGSKGAYPVGGVWKVSIRIFMVATNSQVL
jgi:hypothetical protein